MSTRRLSVFSSILAATFALSFFFITAANKPVFSQDEIAIGTHKIVTLKLKNYKNAMKSLTVAGFDIAGVDLEKGLVDLVLSGNELKSLQSMVATEVVSSKLVETRLAPDAGYHTYDEVLAEINTLQTTYPQLVKIEEIGKSLENRPIMAVKISDNVTTHENDEPVILFNAMHHAREVMTTEVAMDTMEQLLTNYGTEENLTRWVDTTEIWIVPMLNPDGNHKVWHGSNMWRKNTKGGYGVDINRNYPYQWGACGGSSGSQWSETFRGDAAGSEPETQTLMNLVSRIKPVFSISYHSYSELVLYPYGCDGVRSVNRDVVELVGKQIADLLPSDNSSSRRYKPGTPWEILYDVDGGDIDWMHHEHQVIPYVIELNGSSQGFQPSYDTWRDRTVEKSRKAWEFLLARLEGSGIRGRVITSTNEPAVGTKVAVENSADLTLAKVEHTVATDGSFHVVLNPGTYKITFTSPAGESAVQEIEVGATLVRMEHQF